MIAILKFLLLNRRKTHLYPDTVHTTLRYCMKHLSDKKFLKVLQFLHEEETGAVLSCSNYT